MSEEQNGEEQSDEEVNGDITKDADYRWKWLATIWVMFYGLGFPAWVIASSVTVLPVDLAMVRWEILGALTLAWGGTVVYAIGRENVEVWADIKSMGGG